MATSGSAALAEAPSAHQLAPQRASQPSATPTPVVVPAEPALRKARASTSEPSGRQRHDEKITVYLSADELVLLDEAKAALYRDHGLKVDRGRIVREAVSLVIADLGAKGEASILARRLRER